MKRIYINYNQKEMQSSERGRPIFKSYNHFNNSNDLISFNDCNNINTRIDANASNRFNDSNHLNHSNGSTQNQNKYSFCGFCKRNGELPQRYMDHITKDRNGRVVCPMLRKHVCELCGATGDDAHTRSYCPVADLGRNDPFFKSIWHSSNSQPFHNMVSLKRSRVNSAGKVRKFNKY